MDKDAWHRNSLDHRERVTTLTDEQFKTVYEYLVDEFRSASSRAKAAEGTAEDLDRVLTDALQLGLLPRGIRRVHRPLLRSRASIPLDAAARRQPRVLRHLQRPLRAAPDSGHGSRLRRGDGDRARGQRAATTRAARLGHRDRPGCARRRKYLQAPGALAGLSFYTFSCISYLADVYSRRVAAERHAGYFAAYVAFFPKLLAGPIERAQPFLAACASRSASATRRSPRVCNCSCGGCSRRS